MAMEGPVVHADEMSISEDSTATEGSGLCGASHGLATMACILALLSTVLALIAIRRAELSVSLPRSRANLLRAVAFAALTERAPPDLNALSVSRT
jgi:hypothetical protein